MLLDLSRETVDLYQQTLDLVQTKYEVGQVTMQDIHLAKADLASSEEALRQAESGSQQARRSLELLLGRYPGAEIEARSELPPMPPPVPVAWVPMGATYTFTHLLICHGCHVHIYTFVDLRRGSARLSLPHPRMPPCPKARSSQNPPPGARAPSGRWALDEGQGAGLSRASPLDGTLQWLDFDHEERVHGRQHSPAGVEASAGSSSCAASSTNRFGGTWTAAFSRTASPGCGARSVAREYLLAFSCKTRELCPSC